MKLNVLRSGVLKPTALAGLVIVMLLITTGIGMSHSDEPHDVKPDSVQTEPVASPSPGADLDSVYAVIGESFEVIRPVFRRACFDCHSAETQYPWYHKLPFVKDLIDDDIREARKHLDMTNGFPFKGHAKPVDDLYSLRGVLEEGDMPPLKYRLLHWNAKPGKAEQLLLMGWIDQSLRLLAAHGQYPYGRADLVPTASTAE